MNKSKISDEQMLEMIEIVNTLGYKKAQEEIKRRYDISYDVFKYEIRNSEKYSYNRATKQYTIISATSEPFMSEVGDNSP